jgi:hypothetical protein
MSDSIALNGRQGDSIPPTVWVCGKGGRFGEPSSLTIENDSAGGRFFRLFRTSEAAEAHMAATDASGELSVVPVGPAGEIARFLVRLKKTGAEFVAVDAQPGDRNPKLYPIDPIIKNATEEERRGQP